MPVDRLRSKSPFRHYAVLPLLVGLAGPFSLGSAQAAPGATAGTIPAPPNTSQQKSLLLQMQDAFTNIAQTVEPTVVNIKSEQVPDTDSSDGEGIAPAPTPRRGSPTPGLPRSRRMEATGSGVIIRADGYILTNDHVVEGARNGIVTVTLADGREYQGHVYPDFKSDLAVVKIDSGPTSLPVAGFADAASIRPGQWAVAVGSPFDLQNTMTVGVISAVGRHQSIGGESAARYYPDLIQTDAAINPGNSGGPLFNIDGKVVGINVAIESPVEGSAGVGFAIPSDIAQTIMNTLIQSGKVTRGYLGISPEDLTPAMQTFYGQKSGAFIRDVQLDSPAGKSGLQAADIVTSYDGKPILGEVSLRESISATPPSKAVLIAFVRDGKPSTTTVKLGTSPTLPTEASLNKPVKPAVPPAVKLGLTVRDLLAKDRLSLNLPPATTGVLVTGVEPGSPAEQVSQSTGIPLNGAVLQKIGRKSITNKADLNQAAALLSSGTNLTLVILYTDNNQVHQSAVTVRL